MKIDTRKTVTHADAAEIENLFWSMADAQNHETGAWDRNSRRRYLSAIRRLSGLEYVTCHMVEHQSGDMDARRMVAFGRAAQ